MSLWEMIHEGVTVAVTGAFAARDYLKGSVVIESGKNIIEMISDHFRGFWEINYALRTEKKIINRIINDLNSGDVFYDVGSNVGVYACLVGANDVDVHAFEPNPPAFSDLECNVGRNNLDTITIHQKAVSNSSGTVHFRTKESPKGVSQVAGEGNGSEISSIALDDVKARDPDVVKIDVEGHEKEVLEGMSSIVERASPVIYCEVHDANQGVGSLLEEYGYMVEQIDYRAGNAFLRAQMPDENL